MTDSDQIEILDPTAPAAYTLDEVIDQAIIRDNQSPTGAFIYVEEADEA